LAVLEEIKRLGRGALILASHAGLNGWMAPILIQLGYPVMLMQRSHMSPHRLVMLQWDGWSSLAITSPEPGEEGAHLKRLLDMLRQGRWVQQAADSAGKGDGVTGTYLGHKVCCRPAPWALGRAAGVPLVPALVLADEHLVPRLFVGPPIHVSSDGPSKEAMKSAFQTYLDFVGGKMARAPWNLSLVDWERLMASAG
jgi:lauroyl/myristoyl acyltransferase